VIDAIIQLAEKSAKEPRDFQPEDHSELDAESSSMVERRSGAAYKITDKTERYAAVGVAKDKAKAHSCPGRREDNPDGVPANARCVQGLNPPSCAATSSRPRAGSMAVHSSTVRQIVCRSRHAAAHPRLSAFHPR
jgi:hypothetical protein